MEAGAQIISVFVIKKELVFKAVPRRGAPGERAERRVSRVLQAQAFRAEEGGSQCCRRKQVSEAESGAGGSRRERSALQKAAEKL